MKLSLCMIVRDEEHTLSHCLKSVGAIVDEMIVVDTGSTDRTVAIAHAWGATVLSFEWCHDFATARNASLKAATGDWILVLDADEVLVPAIVPALKQAMARPDAIVIQLLRTEVGTHHPPSLLSRLFRNRSDITFTRPYHELIDDSVAAILTREPHWRVVELPGVAIQHTGYQADTIAQRQKVDRARSLMAQYLISHPNDAYICSKLGALYTEIGEVAKGLALLEQGLATQPSDPPIRYELHYHLGDTYRQLGRVDAAAQHYQKAIEQSVSPHLKLGAYNNWGTLLKDQGELERATTLFEQTLAIDPTFAVGYANLGLTLKAAGKLVDAIACYERAIALDATYADAHQNLAVALLKVGRVPESLAAFRQAITLHTQQGSPEAERLRQGLQQMGLAID